MAVRHPSGPHERRVDWDNDLLPHVTASEALAGLTPSNPPEPEAREGTYAGSFVRFRLGTTTCTSQPSEGMLSPGFSWRTRYWSFLLKLHPTGPHPRSKVSRDLGLAPSTGRIGGCGSPNSSG